MKYKIEIWRHHAIVDSFQNDDVQEVLKWYRREWQGCYDNGGCTFYLFKNGSELSFEEEYSLGFFDEE